MTEVRPGSDQSPADDARRAALIFATLGFAALPRIPADMAPTFQALHRWLGSWHGIGDLEVEMHRQGYDLYLVRYADAGWRRTFFTTGQEHCSRPPPAPASEKTPWLAVQRPAARALWRTTLP